MILFKLEGIVLILYNKPFFIPQGQGSLTLEKEENNNYCSYFCFKNKKNNNE